MKSSLVVAALLVLALSSTAIALTVRFSVSSNGASATPPFDTTVTGVNLRASTNCTDPKPWALKGSKTGPFSNMTTVTATGITSGQCVSATYVNPAGESGYSPGTVVPKFTPIFTFPNPANAASSTVFQPSMMAPTATDSAGVAITGAWTYNIATGTVLTAGTYTVIATFTPNGTDATNWNGGTVSAVLTVDPTPAPASVTIRGATK